MPEYIIGSLEDILTNLQEAIAINQCAEDSTTEDRIKTALGLVNGYLLNVAGELESLAKHQEEENE